MKEIYEERLKAEKIKLKVRFFTSLSQLNANKWVRLMFCTMFEWHLEYFPLNVMPYSCLARIHIVNVRMLIHFYSFIQLHRENLLSFETVCANICLTSNSFVSSFAFFDGVVDSFIKTISNEISFYSFICLFVSFQTIVLFIIVEDNLYKVWSKCVQVSQF